MDTGKSPEKKEPFLSSTDKKLLGRELSIQFINRDMLKFASLLLMTLGHWFYATLKIFPSIPKGYLRFIVGAEFFAPPVFFFFISEGYHYTKDRKKYALRLLICAVVTQLPHALVIKDLSAKALLLQWSVLMTLFLGLIALIVIHSSWKLPVRLAAVAGLMLFSWLIQAEWYISGILMILCFDLLREKPLIRFCVFEVLMFISMCVQTLCIPDMTNFLRYFVPPMTAGIIITFFYNGKKGHFSEVSKYFFYVWYPLHLLIQWAAVTLTG
ncbi:MAG: hypothetical protein II773_12310 [Oscillospiraceae bacterium]|nr:hypothetical protein [Oscillospiraceae bacterium]